MQKHASNCRQIAFLALKRVPFAHVRAKRLFYAGFELIFEGWRGLGSTIAECDWLADRAGEDEGGGQRAGWVLGWWAGRLARRGGGNI